MPGSYHHRPRTHHSSLLKVPLKLLALCNLSHTEPTRTLPLHSTRAQIDEVAEVKPWLTDEFRQAIVAFTETNMWQGIMFVATIFALFANDTLEATTGKSAERPLAWMSLICFLLFFFEWVALIVARADYWCSFFFWLDGVATWSMVFDFTILFADDSGSASSGQMFIFRAGRAAKAGTRAGRLVRLIRLVRLFKLFKLVKSKAAGVDSSGETPLEEKSDSEKPSAVRSSSVS